VMVALGAACMVGVDLRLRMNKAKSSGTNKSGSMSAQPRRFCRDRSLT